MSPTSTVGLALPALLVTVTVTVPGLLVVCPLLTVSWKVSVAGLAGAVKVGKAAVALERVTGVPAV